MLGILATLMALGGAVVKLTPTKTDDAWFQALKRAFGGTMICVLLMLPLGCGSGLLGIGDQWTKSDCAKLDLVTFAEGFVCAGGDAEICHHSMLGAYHTGKALCLGLSDEDQPPVPTE